MKVVEENSENFINYSEKIAKVFDKALNSSFSDFYRNKYEQDIANLDATSNYDEFRKIPVLTRDELLQVDWEKRLFVPRSEVAYVGITGGTTNYNRPLTIPVTKAFLESRHENIFESTLSPEKAKKYQLSAVLSLIPGPLNYYWGMMYFPSCDVIPIPGDFRDLERTAKLCEELKLDGIMTIPSLLINLTQELNKTDYKLERVKWISLQGELISNSKLELIQSLFPNAKIEFFYGSNEMANRAGYPCDQRKFEVNSYHPGSNFFFEILDDDCRPVPDGEIGNLVATDLDANKAVPLIRYWTGDQASLTSKPCKCGNNQILKVGGRTGYESIRIYGVTFNSLVLEDVISEFLPELRHYELNISEQKVDDKIKPKILFKIDTDNFDSISQKMRTAVLDDFYLSKDKTLSYFIDNKIFHSFEVVPWPEDSKVGGKNKAIVLDI